MYPYVQVSGKLLSYNCYWISKTFMLGKTSKKFPFLREGWSVGSFMMLLFTLSSSRREHVDKKKLHLNGRVRYGFVFYWHASLDNGSRAPQPHCSRLLLARDSNAVHKHSSWGTGLHILNHLDQVVFTVYTLYNHSSWDTVLYISNHLDQVVYTVYTLYNHSSWGTGWHILNHLAR